MVDKEVKQNQSSCGFQTENMLQVTDWKDDNFSSRGVSVGAVYYTVGTLKFMKHTSCRIWCTSTDATPALCVCEEEGCQVILSFSL